MSFSSRVIRVAIRSIYKRSAMDFHWSEKGRSCCSCPTCHPKLIWHKLAGFFLCRPTVMAANKSRMMHAFSRMMNLPTDYCARHYISESILVTRKCVPLALILTYVPFFHEAYHLSGGFPSAILSEDLHQTLLECLLRISGHAKPS